MGGQFHKWRLYHGKPLQRISLELALSSPCNIMSYISTALLAVLRGSSSSILCVYFILVLEAMGMYALTFSQQSAEVYRVPD